MNPNPKVIGAFVTAALLLTVGMIMYFGTSNFLNRSTYYILFFDQSVNGLNVGSAVKFRGVPVGSVKKIMIRADGQVESSTAIPIVIEVNRSRLENDLGVPTAAFEPQTIRGSIERGLVAELSLESFITGQLFVELGIKPDRMDDTSFHLDEYKGMVEIPTLNSSLDQITADIAQIIADVSDLDIDELNRNINAVLVNAATVMEGIDSEAISQSVTDAADQVTELMASPEFKESLIAVKGAFQEIRDTAESFNLSDGPLAETIDHWTVQITETLDSLDNLTNDASALLKPDSNVRYEFETMLRELGRAARSIRLLSEYLERNPNALLTGRSEEEE